MDSNLLLLLVVGNWSPRFIGTFKRLSDYTVSDFNLVREFVSSFQTVVATAHVLTEVSNLAGSATGESKKSIYQQLAQTIGLLDERSMSSRVASTCPEFSLFGLTDAALSTLCLEIPLLTSDGRLADYLQRKGLQVLTLHSLRLLRNQANNGR